MHFVIKYRCCLFRYYFNSESMGLMCCRSWGVLVRNSHDNALPGLLVQVVVMVIKHLEKLPEEVIFIILYVNCLFETIFYLISARLSNIEVHLSLVLGHFT